MNTSFHFSRASRIRIAGSHGVVDCMFVPVPPSSHVEALTPTVLVFEDGPFGNYV